jgi:hypothetical protein
MPEDPTTERDDQPVVPPIGQPMMMPRPVVPPTAPAAMPAPPAMPTNPTPMPSIPTMGTTPSPAPIQQASPTLPAPQKAGIEKLWDKASGIENPFAKFLARTGTAALGGVEGLAEGLVPRVAMMIPGSEVNTAMRNKAAVGRAEQEQAMRVGQQKANTEQTTAEANQTKATTEASKEAFEETHPKEKNEPEPHWIEGINPETQKPEYYDPKGKTFTGVQPVTKTEQDKTPPHITVMGKDGQQHIMERDPATGQYNIDRGVAAPNYAMVAPGLRTVDVLNPQGVPTVQTLGGKEIGPAATGAYGHSEAQAGAVERAGNELINTIQQNRGKFGNMKAIINSAFLGTPLADPTSQGLASQIASFAALNPALHGFRGKDALNEFLKLIGGLPNNPDALIAGIQGIEKTAGAINPNLPTQGGGGQTQNRVIDLTK